MSHVFQDPNYELRRTWQLIKSQFSASGNWKQKIRASGLPDETQHLIFSVASKSRLLRFEKSEITEELIAHFEDGHRRGHTFDDLEKHFGDPTVTAQLIRNSKKRNRPMLMKLGKLAGLLSAGIFGAYLVSLGVLYSGAPTPNVDYMEELNSYIADIPEEHRAWNIYRDVWADFEFCEGPGGRFPEIYIPIEEGSERKRLIRANEPGWEDAVAKLESSSVLLESFRQGSKLPALGVSLKADATQYSPEDQAALFPRRVFDENTDVGLGVEGISEEIAELLDGSMYATLLPHVQSFRNAARILVVDTRWAIDQGDTDRAVENLEAMVGLSRQASEQPFLVCGLVGCAVLQIAFDTTDEILANHADQFTSDQLEQMQAAFESVDVHSMISFSGERLSMQDIIQRVYTDDGEGDGRITAQGLKVLSTWEVLMSGGVLGEDQQSFISRLATAPEIIGPAALVVVASRQEVVAKMNELVDQMEANLEVPYWEPAGPVDVRTEIEEQNLKYMVLNRTMPSLDSIRWRSEKSLANLDATITALAIHRYQKEEGEWPVALLDLIGSYTDTVPMDRMNGEELRYTLNEDSFRLYSVGFDGDDDLGEPILKYGNDRDAGIYGPTVPPPGSVGDTPLPAREFDFGMGDHLEGDWVLWPRLSDDT